MPRGVYDRSKNQAPKAEKASKPSKAAKPAKAPKVAKAPKAAKTKVAKAPKAAKQRRTVAASPDSAFIDLQKLSAFVSALNGTQGSTAKLIASKIEAVVERLEPTKESATETESSVSAKKEKVSKVATFTPPPTNGQATFVPPAAQAAPAA